MKLSLARLRQPADNPRARRLLAALGLYLILAVVYTAPTILHMSTATYGRSSDINFNVWMIWWRKISLLSADIHYGFQNLIAAPFGTHQISPGFSGLFVPAALIAVFTNEIFAVNVMYLAAIVLSGLLTFAIVDRLTETFAASLLASLVFTFSPYMIQHLPVHVDLAQQWVIPLTLLAVMNLYERRSPGATLLAGGAVATAIYVNPYYAYQSGVICATVIVVWTAARWRGAAWASAVDGRLIGLIAAAGAVGVVLALPELIPILRDQFFRPSDPLQAGAFPTDPGFFFYGASHPWDFVLPASRHPLWGSASSSIRQAINDIGRLDFRPPFIAQRFDLDIHWYWLDKGVDVMYLGIVNLGLIGWTLGRRRPGEKQPGSPGDRSIWVATAISLIVAAWLFSQPPYLPVGALFRKIAPILHRVLIIPTPSVLTMTFLSPLRYPSRFVVTILLGVSILVGSGLAALAGWLPQRWMKASLYAAYAVLLALDFGIFPAGTTSDWGRPDAYVWLSEQKAGSLTAIYPWDDYGQVAYQFVHGQPLTNAIQRPQLSEDPLVVIMRQTVGDPEQPGAVERLAALGVSYIVDSDRMLPASGREGVDLRLETDTARIFEVTADPPLLAVLDTPQGGMWTSQADWQWQGAAAEIILWNPRSEDVKVDIALTAPDRGIAPTAGLSLTPAPAEINWQGALQANPFWREPYPADAVVPRETGQGWEIRGLSIRTGESVLTLSWPEGRDSGAYPAVSQIQVRLSEGDR